MRLVLDLGSAATRAVADQNATADEMKIKDLTVFIYGANGVLEGTPIDVAFDDLTEVTDNKFKTDALKATTGAKTIFVGANMTDALKAVMKATPVNGLSGKGVNEAVANITQQTGFAMFSTVGATPTLVENADADNPDAVPAANEVTVTLQRLASKIAVGMSAKLDDPDVQQGAAGTISDLGFTVDNINKMYYLTYGAQGATAKDANMTKDQYKNTDFELKADFKAVQYKDITAGTAYVADKGGNWGIDYASENLTTDKMIKGVTRIVVKGKFTPKSGVKVTDDGQGTITFAEEDGLIAEDATYIQLDFAEAGGFAFFPATTTDPQLKAFMAQKKGVAVDLVTDDMLTAAKKTYTNGMNYWWVTVKDNQGDMLRNNYYKVDITSIFAPGRTDGAFDDKKDDTEIGKETKITVNVTVEPWNMVAFDADLRP